ncbi:MAG: NAD(P)-dependent oxidoreductase [Bacteroidetes bacterium]|nr:NAD(P)-dependent oxidoreductase [Bacteroidota bacterium]
MKILVTGASGFIGSNLITYLLDHMQGVSVYCLSRPEKGAPDERCKRLVCDLSKGNDAVFPDENFDVVIHLAQSRHYRDFPAQAADIYAVNVQSTFALAEWARKHGVNRFVMASTGSVYQPTGQLLKETDPVFPGSFYTASKLAAENLLRPYCEFYSIDVLRIFSPYGKGQKNMLVPNLIGSIRQGKQVTLSGKDGLVLSPVYIDDCSALIYGLLKAETAGYEVYNLGGAGTVTLREMAMEISRIAGCELNIVEDTSRPVVNISSDSGKLYSKTGYFPAVNIQDGLKKCLE